MADWKVKDPEKQELATRWRAFQEKARIRQEAEGARGHLRAGASVVVSSGRTGEAGQAGTRANEQRQLEPGSRGGFPLFRCAALTSLQTPESPLDYKEIKPVNPKGNQPWLLIGRTDAEAETPILWPPDAKSRLIGKAPDAGKDWRQEEKGTAEDKMVAYHHHYHSMDMNLSKLREIVEDARKWHATVHGLTKAERDSATEQQASMILSGGSGP